MERWREKKLQDEYFLLLYKKQKAHNFASSERNEDLCAELGIEYNGEASLICTYLRGKGWIEWPVGFAWVNITLAGRDKAETMDNERFEAKEQLVLQRLYENRHTRHNKQFTPDQLSKELNLSVNEVTEILNELDGKGWLGGTDEGVCINAAGIKEYERLRGPAVGNLLMPCPKCNEEIRETARFCENCGVSLNRFKAATIEQEGFDIAASRTATDTLIGLVLDEKYKILERLDQGGVGAVYRAEHLNIGGDVAIKVLHPRFVADPSFVERFRREARAAAQIHHRNIVRVFDFVEAREDSPAFIVMEYVPGRSLKTALEREGRLETSRAISLMREICAAVGAAHNVAITHRDIKPANIILAEPSADTLTESIKLIDFGIAKAPRREEQQDITVPGSIMGTPQYMSPEQCRGQALDARSDVYSLGVILYELLTGRRPFVGTDADVVSQHLHDKPAALPRQLNISTTVQKVLFRALSKKAEDRQFDALDLSRELNQATRDMETEQGSKDEEATTIKIAVPRPSLVSSGFYNLQDIDIGVLKRSCEIAIERGYLKHNDVRSLLTEFESKGMSRQELFDSLEVLTEEHYIKPSKTVGGGLPINDFEITEFGFEQYANAYVADYQSMVDAVRDEIIQDKKGEFEKPSIIVEHILDHLASRGFLKLSKRMGGKIVIMHVSAQMRRQYERRNSEDAP